MSFFEKRKQKPAPQEKRTAVEIGLDYLHDVVYILAIILVLFTFCVRVVIVNGSSMFSTLAHGDCLLLLNRPLCGQLEQGDIVVASMDRFKNGEAIVKRVVATEGQTVDIDFRAGIVYVDGVALEEDYIYSPTHMSEGVEFPLVVREGCVFLMGDNRGDSRDSRAPEIGQVDEREILGQVVFLMMPGTGRNEYTVDWDPGRIGGLN